MIISRTIQWYIRVIFIQQIHAKAKTLCILSFTSALTFVIGALYTISGYIRQYSINYQAYRQISNIKRTFVGNQIVGHSDVVGASPVGAAPTTSSFST